VPGAWARRSSLSPFVLRLDDISVFSVYKHYHSEAIKATTTTGYTKFTKLDFLAAITSIRAKTFTPHTIRLGF
jgi:hypothetical protein